MADISSILRTDFKEVDKRDAVSSVQGWLNGDTKKVPIVMDGDRPFGIVNERAIVGRSLDARAHLDGYVQPTKALKLTDSIEEAAARLSEHRAAHIPVVDERGRLAGYVSAVDVARERLDGEKAVDVCFPVTGLREEQTMGEAVNVFTKEYVGYLPVLDDAGRLSGVLPRRAVLMMEFNSGNRGRKDAVGEKTNILHDPVRGFMDTPPRTVPPNSGADDLLETLEEDGYALVADQGRFLGVVTPETIFRAANGGH